MKSPLTCILGCQVHHLLLLFSSYGSTKDPFETTQINYAVVLYIRAITEFGQKRAGMNHFLSLGNIGYPELIAINQFSAAKAIEK